MATVALEPLFHHCRPEQTPKFPAFSNKPSSYSFNYLYCSGARRRRGRGRGQVFSNGARFCKFNPSSNSSRIFEVRASSEATASLMNISDDSTDVLFNRTFPVHHIEKVEGKILVRLEKGQDEENWQLSIGCNLPGKWVLHWGVNYVNDTGSEWDQPPLEMRPPESIPIKDYAVETPLVKLSTAADNDPFHQVKIQFNTNSSLAAINFVLKDEETGAWYQHRGRDFKVPLVDFSADDDITVGAKKGLPVWPGTLGKLSNMLLKSEGTHTTGEVGSSDLTVPIKQKRCLEAFSEEHSIVKEIRVDNSVNVSIKRCLETANNLLCIDTDLSGDVVVHWGVCKDESKRWEIPAEPYPPQTLVFKNKALRTQLQKKEGAVGCSGLFALEEEFMGFLFVLKLNDSTWLNYMGDDFYLPIPSVSGIKSQSRQDLTVGVGQKDSPKAVGLDSSLTSGEPAEDKQAVSVYTDVIINEIRNLVTGISSEKSRKTKSRETQEDILHEIEKLAAEAYSIFRSSGRTVPDSKLLEAEEVETPVKICSGTGSGFEIVCQGFNWESHKSGRWYMQLQEKAAELSSLGFTVVWLPPPTESIAPEGYMPKDLYNLNSRYGNIDELKGLVKKFHEVGIKVLGDAVLNHRCAHKQNQNGIWNIFGGRLNWDDRAVVADDPHFQGRGNKSSGDNFHAAPNIDHSQEFVRKDLKEWLCWLRKEIGYDGWRLDFVRGFWGGYVKDYMEATEPYFAVGEYWDSLSYTYGEMDHNQDAHRQRIVDWINATNGTAGAFDVTTKGILHAAIERCEYWRLSDEKGKPPGVVGWWPSRAVTFIENHDTGSTQGHWRFPGGREMQGYAYILTHPGTPSVFYDHIFSHHHSEISALLSIRNRNKIHCRSAIKITKVERDVYAAMVDEKVAVKIGPGHYEPPSGPKKWSLAAEGNDYKVWETS